MSVWLTRGFLRLCARLPLSVAHRIGAGIGWLGRWLPSRYREYSYFNLRICFPELSDRERSELLRDSFMEDGKCFMELGAFWYRDRAWVLQKIREVQGREHLDAALEQGKGVILAGPHLGAWEMMGLYLSTLGEMHTLYRPPRDQSFESLMVSKRGRFGAHQVMAGPRGVRQLVKALKRNAMVAILPDQQPLQGQGVFANFFHSPALTMTLLPRLAQRTGAPVIFAYAERLPRGEGYVAHLTQAWQVGPQATAEQMAAALNRHVEGCVRTIPSQYMWGYKRFSERPPGIAQAYPKNRKLARREAREKRAARRENKRVCK